MRDRLSGILGKTFSGKNSDFLLFFFCFFSALLIEPGDVESSDGDSMLAVSQAILHGHLAIPAGLSQGTFGLQHRPYSKHPIGLTLVSLPATAIGDVGSIIAGHQKPIIAFLATGTMAVITSTLAVLMKRLCQELGARETKAIAVSLLALFTTFELSYTLDYFSEPLATLGLVIAALFFLRRSYAWCGFGIAIAFAARPQALVVLPLFILGAGIAAGGFTEKVQSKSSNLTALASIAKVFAIPLASLLLVAVYNDERFGSPTSFGYQPKESFSGGAALHSVPGFIWSPSKSLVLFCPLIFIALPLAIRAALRRSQGALLLLSMFFVTALPAVFWDEWSGNWAWGPRLLLNSTIPLLAALSFVDFRRRPERVSFILLAVVGFAVNGSVIIVPNRAQQLTPASSANGPTVWEQWRLVPETFSYTSGHLDKVSGGTAALGEGRRFIPLWQVSIIRELGRKIGLAIAGPLTLLLLVLWSTVLRALVRRRWEYPSEPIGRSSPTGETKRVDRAATKPRFWPRAASAQR